MTRAALLPAGADPFLLAYWLRHYRTWAEHVDELHVAVCGPIPDPVVEYLWRLIRDTGATMHRFEKRTEHGQVLTFLLDQTSADHVLLIEDDAFVRSPSVIDESFRAIESGETDIIGCPRNSYASENVLAAAHRRFGPEPRGLALWPCFAFIPRAPLAATDRILGGRRWEAGETLLGTTLETPGLADTFISATYQLRDMGLRISLREMHRVGDPIPPDAPWFHVGSLSSGHGWAWMNDKMTPELYLAEIAQWAGLPVGEIAKRVAWWGRAWDHWDGAIPDYHTEYGAYLRQFMGDFGVTQDEVDRLRASFDYLITWAES